MNDILSESNDLRCIYQDIPEYVDLREEDKKFFDNLFILLLFNEDKVYSNKYLSQRFKIPLSTLEKRIRRLDRANLIKRKTVNELVDNEKWITTSRTLELDPATFAFVKAKSEEARIQAARQQALEKDVYIPKDKVDEIKEDVKASLKPITEEPPIDPIAEFRRLLTNL